VVTVASRCPRIAKKGADSMKKKAKKEEKKAPKKAK
jgi:hypothetical protein